MKKITGLLCVLLGAVCIVLVVQIIGLRDSVEFYQEEYKHLDAINTALIEENEDKVKDYESVIETHESTMGEYDEKINELEVEKNEKDREIRSLKDEIDKLDEKVFQLMGSQSFYEQVTEAREIYVNEVLLDKRQDLDLKGISIDRKKLIEIIYHAIEINNDVYALYGTMPGDFDPKYDDIPELKNYVVVDKYKTLDELRSRLLETYTLDMTESIIEANISFDLSDDSKPYIYYDDKLFTQMADRGSDMYTEVYMERLIAQVKDQTEDAYVIHVLIPYVSLMSEEEAVFSTSYQSYDIELIYKDDMWKVNSNISSIGEN